MYQSLTLVGYLGRNPEMRYSPSGQTVTSFSVATSRQYTDNNGQAVKETVWFKVTVWGKQAESCNQYLKKGSKVLVEGRLTADPATGSPRLWTRQDGSAGTSFEVTANTVRFLSSRDEGGANTSGDTGAPEEDIPF